MIKRALACLLLLWLVVGYGVVLAADPTVLPHEEGAVYLPLILRSAGSLPTPTPTATPTVTPGQDLDRLIALTNAERTARGLPALVKDERLMAAAGRHSLDMATNNFFSHTGSDGSDPDDRIRDAGYTCGAWGENIGAGYRTPEEAIAGWMASPDHRDNILSANFRHIGVGYAYHAAADYGHYWTQVFAAPGG